MSIKRGAAFCMGMAVLEGCADSSRIQLEPPRDALRLLGGYARAHDDAESMVTTFCAARPKAWRTAFGSPGLPEHLPASDNLDGGIDSAPVYFGSAHGVPGSWTVDTILNDHVEAPHLRLGDGHARYFLLYSCQVFAHGPMIGADFPEPGKFEPGQQSAVTTWQSAFGEDLRLACGASSNLIIRPAQTAQMWRLNGQAGLDVADAFLTALLDDKVREVPLCITRGEEDPKTTPLFDPEFLVDGTERPPTGTLFHLEYPAWAEPSSYGKQMLEPLGLLPEVLRRFSIVTENLPLPLPPLPPPSPVPAVLPCPAPLKVRAASYFGSDAFDCPGTLADLRRCGDGLTDADYEERAWKVVDGLGWMAGGVVSRGEVVRLQIDTYDRESERVGECRLKGVVVTFRRGVRLPPGLPPFSGWPFPAGRPGNSPYFGLELAPGGQIVIWLAPDGTVVHGFRNWEFVRDPRFPPNAVFVPAAQARQRAEAQGRVLRLPSWGWRSVNGALTPVYVFDVEILQTGAQEGPPFRSIRRVEVPAITAP